MKRRMLGGVVMSALLAGAAFAQDGDVSWKRTGSRVQPELRLFHSTQAINLPTAETLGKGEFQFEIAHRFYPPFAEGLDELWGLDGPVVMRLGLGWAPTDRLLVTMARSNVGDNVDLQAKYKLVRLRGSRLPLLVAVQGGGAWNSEKRFDRDRGDSRNFQYYGQLVINTMVRERLALGAVPSLLSNSDIESRNARSMLAMGLYVQYYVNRLLSLLAEWTPKVSGESRADHHPAAFGLELETGGHFFKIIATNSVLLNPPQYLAGSEYAFSTDEWRLGFLITRLLRF